MSENRAFAELREHLGPVTDLTKIQKIARSRRSAETNATDGATRAGIAILCASPCH